MSLRGHNETELFIVWQRSMYDDQEHAITDEEFAYGDRKDDGHYEAVCGHLVYMADSFAAPGHKCQACVLFLRARGTMQSAEERLALPSSRLLVRLKTMFCYKPPRHAAGEVQDV